MESSNLLPVERIFRIWMLISALMFGFAVPFFFFGGTWIVPVINAVSAHLLPLPLYPLTASGTEGAFWRVLSVSMMVMLTWACWTIYKDVRLHSHLTPIILLSKLCSTSLYLVLFLSDHYLAYLIGALTDGPIFVFTYLLWFLARPADRHIDEKEEEILAVVGDTLMPSGGAFNVGFMDLREACLVDVRRSLSVLDPMTLFGTRLLVRAVNLAPIMTRWRFTTLLMVSRDERVACLTRLEKHPWALFRMMMMAVKTILMMAFFNQPEASSAVGHDPDGRIRP